MIPGDVTYMRRAIELGQASRAILGVPNEKLIAETHGASGNLTRDRYFTSVNLRVVIGG
jgi:hypothetical protein